MSGDPSRLPFIVEQKKAENIKIPVSPSFLLKYNFPKNYIFIFYVLLFLSTTLIIRIVRHLKTKKILMTKNT